MPQADYDVMQLRATQGVRTLKTLSRGHS